LNSDGKVNSTDLVALKRFLLKEIDELPLNVKLCADLRQLDGKAERIGRNPDLFSFF